MRVISILFFYIHQLHVVHRVTPLLVGVYLTRTAVINAPGALADSVMMDFVPRRRRGMWAAVSSVLSFGWSGSAFLGGYTLSFSLCV